MAGDEEANGKDAAMNDTNHSTASSTKKKSKAKPQQLATVGETLSFVWECGSKVRFLLIFGSFAAMLNGLVYPILAYLFSSAFADISSAENEGLKQVRELAYTFMLVGTYALICATIQGWCFEIVAYYGSQAFRLQWFRALLRQDPAYFDVRDIGGLAAQIGPNAGKFRRGVGRKMGEGIQFFTTGVGGLAYAFFSSWRVALVILAIIPFVAIAAMATVFYNQSKGKRAAASYKTAGSVAYSTVSAIRTVLSLNAIPSMVERYQEATSEAYELATQVLIKIGFANGSMLGTFLLLYAALTLYGSALLYRDVEDTGCDPSDGVSGNDTCDNSAPAVFGAMLGVAFAGQGISQFGNATEAFTAARVAVFEALAAIHRLPGADEEIIFKEEEESDADELGNTSHSGKGKDTKESKDTSAALVALADGGKSVQFGKDEKDGEMKPIKAILPKYEIDAFSNEGLKPTDIQGAISFQDVEFNYPTRVNDPILQGLSTEIKAGSTVAFVGPSGGGKSTVIAMIERFYDPSKGSILLDGTNLKDINVKHLRSSIGYVGQEPTLFATSIRGNIRYGKPDATDEEIEEAARLANAHDFITSFTEGYETQCGDKGSQLSGGQKQRIAIARVLVGNPKILLLDEATSALDAESELVVQDALDNILEKKKITTLVVAHRLSTIRNADEINVIVGGKVVEQGTHDELMGMQSYYRRLVDKQEGGGGDSNPSSNPSSRGPSRSNSAADLAKMDSSVMMGRADGAPHIRFRNVTFAYPTRPKKTILNKFNLVVKQGETIALVGPSGQGKSTTVGMIERFYDPTEGTVEYFGTDIKDLNVAWYRDQIGYVGQEPTLFNDTIANNVAYGAPGATREQIEEACKQANAHDFILEFNEGYETPLGEKTALSGGQKQRIAIARALLKSPKVLLLDEATSALDNESEALVQEAIDKLISSGEHTVLMIAHRLSTVRGADKIAVVADGKVVEFGSHDELLLKEDGRYKRLNESSKRTATMASTGLKQTIMSTVDEDEEEEEKHDWEKIEAELQEKAFNMQRARELASPDMFFICIGSIGAVMAGGVFPMWGVLFSETINILYRRVEPCDNALGEIPGGFDTCEDYWEDSADDMRDSSFTVAIFWGVVFVGCIIGNILTFWGFGMASERMNKRIRDSTFSALLRQEVAFFDKHSVGSITSQLQDDAAKLHAFSGEPIRAFVVASSSVLTGLVLSFIFMWPFALLAIGCVPLMGFATSIEMKQFLGEDEGTDSAADELNSPGGIIVETLLNIRTVSALTLEEQRFADYEKALLNSEPNHRFEAFMGGVTSGLSMFIQQWINALQMWFGGWLLFTFPEDYEFNDFLIANFAVLFALFGLGAAFQDVSDSNAVKVSAGRIFYLLDRVSAIDPMSEEGKKLDVDVSC
uniref:Bile salt export pump n=2 Tax=Entomoneis paludosa TaxID=265537 RepID=A0A7S2YI40_9STRA|mmetsp:Transcript_34053/g.70802  ORF Transcript_34053/g.70802 Transcript_34053/m.70802 type:complete len:1399 (+) Transcript_34053:64-4260(+)